MKGIWFDVQGRHLVVGDLDALLIGIGIKLAGDGEAGLGGGAGDQLDDGQVADQRLSGLARQFMVMKANSLCSMRFHLLVPGGRWFTVMAIPSSSANTCNSRFHKRTRLPLLPPQSALIRSRVAVG